MGGEDSRAHPGKISRAAHRRAYRHKSRRAWPSPLHHDFRCAYSASLHPSRSSPRLERRKSPRLSRPTALHARHSCHRISRQTLHHAAILGLRLARGNQPALQIFARARRQRTFCCLRPAHADGLRLRSSRQRRRSRQMRRGHRLARRHGNTFWRHRSGEDHSLDDHQLARFGAVGYVLGRR